MDFIFPDAEKNENGKVYVPGSATIVSIII